MSKKALGLMLTVLFVVSLALPVAAVEYYECYKNIRLTIGQTTSYINDAPYFVEQAPYVKSGRTMVPLRFVTESLHAYVDWQPSTSTATIEMDDGTIIKVTVGSKTAYVNNQAKTLEAPAETKGGRTFVPLRFIGEAIGAKVGYNSAAKTVTITLVDTSDWEEYVEPVTGFVVFFPDEWSVDSEGSSLVIESDDNTTFELSYDNRALADILGSKKNRLVSEGWKVASDTGTVVQLTKLDPNERTVTLTYIISTRKIEGGYLVFDVETNSVAQEQDLAIIDKITPGDGI